jgi:hypothetical protein
MSILGGPSLAAALLLSPLAAHSSHVVADLAVTVHAEHFVVRGHVIDDLDVLETAVRSLGPRTVRLQACGGNGERAQRAAAHRFRDMDLELRRLQPHEAACQETAAPRAFAQAGSRGPRPVGIDDALVDQWWHASMP